MSKKINNKNNVQENIFYKTSNINIQDYIPNNIKQNNIREEIPLKFPEVSNRKYPYELYPNCLFEKWPSEEEIKSFDFNIHSNIEFNDPNNHLLVLPYSLRKETFNSMIWMRPKEYIQKKLLIQEIKQSFPNKNYNYIKNKFEIAYNNILNFKINRNSISNESISKLSKYDNGNKNIEIIKEKENKNDNKEVGLNSIDNFRIGIKERNSIDISTVQRETSDYSQDFINGKLSKKERAIFEEFETIKKFDFFIVNNEIIENKEVKKIEKMINNKNKNIDKEIEKKELSKLFPNNLSLNNYLSEYCRWVSSIFQIIIDNNIYIENDPNHFIRRIYPQNENGTPIYNPSGKYCVKLYHMGEERKIEIDDKFPVNKSTFEPFFPHCESPYELWPLILTKALIKLYSFKYRSEIYEYNEVGDNSILYSLTKYFGIQLPNDKIYSFLYNLQFSNKSNNTNENSSNTDNTSEEFTFLKYNNNNFNYDLLIGYLKSNNLNITDKKTGILNNLNNPNKILNSPIKQMLSLPTITKKIDSIKSTEKLLKLIKRNSTIMKNSNSNTSITKEIHKNSFNEFSSSPSHINEITKNFNLYNRFKTGEGS